MRSEIDIERLESRWANWACESSQACAGGLGLEDPPVDVVAEGDLAHAADATVRARSRRPRRAPFENVIASPGRAATLQFFLPVQYHRNRRRCRVIRSHIHQEALIVARDGVLMAIPSG